MIGLAFSHLGGAENIGYIIPTEEIELFLQDISDGHYDGKPALHDHLQAAGIGAVERTRGFDNRGGPAERRGPLA